jgi:hypothetical protein
MPEFGTPFAGLASARRLTHEELVRTIRYAIASEFEAVQLYMQMSESTNDKLAITVLKDIADEEGVHAGEFLRLLMHLTPDEEKFYAEGAGEVEQIMKGISEEKASSLGEEKADEKGPKLPYCTDAPSAEHHRASRHDSPYQDGRSGDIEQG